jgi:hypothetical protein
LRSATSSSKRPIASVSAAVDTSQPVSAPTPDVAATMIAAATTAIACSARARLNARSRPAVSDANAGIIATGPIARNRNVNAWLARNAPAGSRAGGAAS